MKAICMPSLEVSIANVWISFTFNLPQVLILEFGTITKSFVPFSWHTLSGCTLLSCSFGCVCV